MRNVHVFTVAAGNYLPKARALFASLRRHHPDWRLHLAVADAPPPAEALASVGADENYGLGDLGIPGVHRWAFCHALIELATAIKPFVLRKILARADCDAVIYFDPDVVVFAPLTEVTDALAASDIALTPHLTRPEPTLDGIIDFEISTLRYGIYNLGFIAVAARAEGRAFAAWWADRVYRHCREDAADGIYTDQRWIDLVPSMFGSARILRSPGLNAARWNLAGRAIAGDFARGFTVNGRPLAFFHFSQVDLIADDRATGGQPAVAALLSWYQREIVPTPAERKVAPRWAYSHFADGSPVQMEQRLVYRARAELQRAHPDPLAAGPGSYLAWWNAHARAEYPRLFQGQAREDELQALAAALAYRKGEEDIVAGD